MPHLVLGLEYPVIGVRDLDRSLSFYVDLLGFSIDDIPQARGIRGEGCVIAANGRRIVLETVDPNAKSDWVADSQQLGIRHIGLKVDSVDRWAAILREAGTQFTIAPRDAFGGVRIAFFLDPDGSLLEVVEDFVDYTDVVSPLRVLDERAAGLPATPRVDHVAVTVSDFASALEFYGERCGLERYAELADPEDARGLRLNYFWTSAIVLEVFSFQARTLPNPWRANTRSPGLSRLVFAVSDIEESRTLLRHNHTDGCHDSLTPPTRMVTDCDGTPIELVVR